MKNKKIACAKLLAIPLILFFFTANKVDAQNNPTTSQDQISTLATVNIYNARIISVDVEKNVKISFEISNVTGIQPGVRYGVQLVSKGDRRMITDEYVYDETLVLGENDLHLKEVNYKAPKYLTGNYEVWVISKNEKGMPLGQGVAGEINLVGSGEYIDIAVGSCLLKVKDGDGREYEPLFGVDVSAKEEILVSCDVKNNSNNPIEAVSSFDTYYRTTFGKLLEKKDGEKVVIGAGEKKNVSLLVPKITNPQSYSVNFFLKNSKGEIISNKVNFQYVIQGQSGTIQNLTLNKNYYKKGETAVVSFFWVGSADIFTDSRGEGTRSSLITLDLDIKDSRGSSCIEPTKKEFTAQHDINKFNVNIVKNCQNPSITVSMSDAKGNILDQESFSVKSSESKSKIAWGPKLSKSLLVIIIGLILSAFVLVLVWKKRSTGKLFAVLLVIFTSVALVGFFFEKAQADTVTVNPVASECMSPWYNFHANYPAVYSINPNKTIFSPGEQMTLSVSSVQSSYCSNGWNATQLTAQFNNTSNNGLLYCSQKNYSGCSNAAATLSGPVQSAPGTYYITGRGAAFGVANLEYVNCPEYGPPPTCDELLCYCNVSRIPQEVHCFGVYAPCARIRTGYWYCPIDNGFGLSSSTYSIPYTVQSSQPVSPPSCSAYFSPNPITSGQNTTAYWSSQNDADGLIPYTCNGNIGSGTLSPASGSVLVTPSPSATQTCTLTVENSSGGRANCSATINVQSACVGNGCQSWTCQGESCWDGCQWQSGTQVCRPDYVVQSLSTSSVLIAGQSISFSGTVRNSGMRNASVSSQTRLRLDIHNDGTYDTTFTNQSTSALSVNATEVEAWSNVWIAIAGTHRFEICADANNNIVESNELNNCTTRTFTITNPTIDNAQCVSSNHPPTVVAGRPFSATITMRNNGTTTWTTANNYKLGSQNPADNKTWGFNRISLPSSIAPNNDASFTANFTAPATPGTYPFQWQMLIEGVKWFGDSCPVANITVVNPSIDNAQCVSSNHPPTVTAGETFSATITMRNNGTTTWTTANNYKLGSQNPADNKTWGFNRISLPSSIAPNNDASFTANFTAPMTPGTYPFQWRMLIEGVKWFGDSCPVASTVTVNCSPVSGQCGLAHGKSFSSAPTSNLCSIGTPSTVSGNGPWTWTCSGTCDGSPDYCLADKIPEQSNYKEVVP